MNRSRICISQSKYFDTLHLAAFAFIAVWRPGVVAIEFVDRTRISSAVYNFHAQCFSEMARLTNE